MDTETMGQNMSRKRHTWNRFLSSWPFVVVLTKGHLCGVSVLSLLLAWTTPLLHDDVINRNIFCDGGFPSQRPVNRSFLFSLMCTRTNGSANICGWFGTPLCSLWRHYDIIVISLCILQNDMQTEACTHNMVRGQYFLYLSAIFEYLSPFGKNAALKNINQFYFLF